MSKEQNIKKNHKKTNTTIYRIGFVVFFAAFIVIAVLLVKNWMTEQEAQRQFENLSNQVADNTGDTATTETETGILEELGITVPEKNLDWDALKESNEHIYAWIYIPNTNVDYPVLQHPTDDNYYLEYNLDGSKGRPGCIYSQKQYNSQDFTDFNTLLYGHNMKNGTMFQSLHNFEDETFFNENRYVYIYTPEWVYVYDIFGAYAFDDRHLLYHFDNADMSDREAYLEEVFGIRDMSAHFRDGVEVTTDSNILTLSTCINSKPDQRYLVQGVLVNPVE